MNIASDAVGEIASRRSNSLTAIVEREIERMIVSGDLEAGARVNEQHLATRLGVSRGPIREALRAIERAGLVNSVVNLGTFVRTVGIAEAEEMYDMRGVVFGFSCARLAEQATTEQKDALTVLVGAMHAAIGVPDPSDYYRLNLRFHDLVMDFAGHVRAKRIYQDLVREGHLFRQRSLQPVGSMTESNSEHAAILDAILARDPVAARRTAEEHHFSGKRRWLATLTVRDTGVNAENPRAGREELGRLS